MGVLGDIKPKLNGFQREKTVEKPMKMVPLCRLGSRSGSTESKAKPVYCLKVWEML